MAIRLFISLTLNILLLSLGILLIIKRGGFAYLLNKVSVNKKSPNNNYYPYYIHKKSQFEILPKSESDIIFLGDSLTNEGEWAE